MASDEVRLHGVTVGTVSIKPYSSSRGRVGVRLGFKPDHVGIMHAAARSLDKGEDR